MTIKIEKIVTKAFFIILSINFLVAKEIPQEAKEFIDLMNHCAKVGEDYCDGEYFFEKIHKILTSCNKGNQSQCKRFALIEEAINDIEKSCYTDNPQLAQKACDEIKEGRAKKVSNQYIVIKESTLESSQEARKLFELCEQDDDKACFNLVSKYENSKRGGHFSPLFTLKKCNSGNMKECFDLGMQYFTGKFDGVGGTTNYFKAKKFFTKACNGGNAKGCVGLGELYRQGYGVRQDSKQAKELYGKGCDLGEQEGCDWYKTLKNQGF